MKGRLQAIGFSCAKILLAFSGVALAIFLIPLLLEGWFLLTTRASSDHERRMTWFLLAVVAIFTGTGTLGFLLMRRWRPASLRLQPVESARTMTGVRIFIYVTWAFIIVVDCLVELPGLWFERVGWTLVTAVLLLGGVHLCVAAHELGHWLMARCLGLEPLSFRIGIGPLLWRRVVSGGLLFEWRLVPNGGMVKAWRRDGRFIRWQYWLVIAAGPAVTLALSLVLWRLFPSWPTHGQAAWPYAGERVGFALLIWNTFLLLNGLVPQRVTFDGKQFSSDGAHLLALLRRPKESPADLTKSVHLQRLGFLWETGQRARAWAVMREIEESMAELPAWLDLPRGLFACEEGEYAVAREALARCLTGPELLAEVRNLVRCQLALSCAGLGDPQAARAHALALLRRVPREERTRWRDHCASIPMITGRSEMVPFAQRWIRRVLARDRASLVFQVTQATLWFEEGDVARAEVAMRELVQSEVDAPNRGAAAFYLARALQQRGAPAQEIAKWRGCALRWCAQLWLHRRVAAELPEAGEPGAVEAQGALASAAQD